MVKRGALSGVEKFYIEGHADLPVEDIAKELDRSVKIVTNYMNSIEWEEEEVEAEPDPASQNVKEDTQMQRLMGRHERNGQKVATVMTKSASELADDQRPKRLSSRKLQEAIHRPRSE